MRTCPICDGPLEPVAEERDIRIGRRSARVLDEFYRCAECGEEIHAPGQMDATQRRACRKIREEEGLLMP